MNNILPQAVASTCSRAPASLTTAPAASCYISAMSSRNIAVQPAARAAGTVVVPGDKSISHRYALLAALADGDSVVEGYSPGADCAATLACLRRLGVEIDTGAGRVVVRGRGLRGLRPPEGPLDAANSGTTARMLAGILAAHAFVTTLTGDASLTRRPMRRIIEPLARMGARLESQEGRLPVTIHGTDLHGIAHVPDVPSAQVKSAVLLAGLQAAGLTTVREPAPTRDHTERALAAFGARVERGDDGTIGVSGGQRLAGRHLRVPGDISSATFWAVLAAGTPGASIEMPGVGLNPTRTAVLAVLRRAGALVEVVTEPPEAGEPAGHLRVTFGEPRSVEIAPHDVPGVIDEIPALAALVAMMPPGHTLTVRGAAELRVKESDRISALAAGFRALGADVDECDDGFLLTARPLRAAAVDAAGDHRLAMAFAIAATRAPDPARISGASAVEVSYPGFFTELARLTSR
jgi:3-phosphoshikimate 1-carboxyvinyltransferase